MTTPPPPSTPPGWYSDPMRPGSLRYWNGRSWEQHQPRPSPPDNRYLSSPAARSQNAWRTTQNASTDRQVRPRELRHDPATEILPVADPGRRLVGPPSRARASADANARLAPKALWFVGAALTVAIVVVAILMLSTSDDAAETSDAAVAAVPDPPSSSLSGSLEDWLSAVCKPGTFYDGLGRSSGIFQGAQAGSFCQGTRSQIFILRYQSDYLLKNDLARGGQAFRYYASGVQDYDTVVFVPLGNNRGDVQPLADFGFAIASVG